MGNSLTCNLDGLMSSNKLLPAVVTASRSAQTATLIFLHGLGDSGHGWAGMLKDLIPEYCKLICPHAPSTSVTLNGGMRMPAWYDIYNLQIDAKQDEKGIMEASAELDKFVAAEISNGIPAKRIVIGGFSQGGSVALYHALTSNRTYGGVIALSSWLPLHSKFISDPSLVQIAKDTAVFQGHGSSDYIVAHDMGRATHELLKGFQLNCCEFCSYDHMGHSSCEQEMDDVKAFLKRNIPAT
ncbi:Acyl protein thioesterase 1 [Fasciola gigantica]|uniref:palmitoyl-protein hydrolase n=1 Tax=Fasciola gigantica TaxID=46835 RepID=A0A504YHF7_FASGI|nr:Acyl protein thioesterase 1 [Fasciola gigantica]